MKKLLFWIGGLIIATAFVSCEKQKKNDLLMNPAEVMKSSKVMIAEPLESTPISTEVGAIPYMIPGENKGGNRTCAEAAAASELIFDEPLVFSECGNKVDYEDDHFASGFPAGLNVWIHDEYHVAFDITGGCVKIGDEFYKVGAVIVKGSNQANVYYYEEGASFDMGLAAPGDKHMVSNITFCFLPCENDFIGVLALKTFLEFEIHGAPYGLSGGTPVPDDDLGIGYNYVFAGMVNHFDLVLHKSYGVGPIGTITAEVIGDNLVVEIDAFNQEVLFKDTWLYFGPEADIPHSYDHYDYYEAADPLPGSLSFTIPLTP